MLSWVAVVAAIIAPVVAPTPAPEPPPAAAQSGTTDISGAKLHSAVTVASISSTKSRRGMREAAGSLIWRHPRTPRPRKTPPAPHPAPHAPLSPGQHLPLEDRIVQSSNAKRSAVSGPEIT